MFTFCPLQGALSESTASQSLLELDGGVKVLIDVGWDETFDTEKLKELEKQIPTLSLILLTHATVPHLAAYAHCCKHFPLFTRIPVYATRPVIDLGRTLTQDLYASTPLAATTIPSTSLAEVSYAYPQASPADHTFLLQAPTSEEIARYFSLIQPLKYSQPHQPLPSPFSPPLNGLTITAYNSGHTLGGTIWHIQHGLESIVYAVDWNQARENVFSGAAWLGGGHNSGGGTEVIEQLRKPTALVCSSRTPETTLARSRRDEQLLESIKLCIARGGTVLIPVDSSARVLELAYFLEHAWRAEASKGNDVIKATKLYLAGRSIGSTMRNARSMLEWMDDSIVREFEAVADESRRDNRGADHGRGKDGAGPFDFKYLRVLERKAQIERVLQLAVDDAEPKPKVILATDSSIEWGFSKGILKAIAGDARNLVVLTEKPSLGTGSKSSLARTLWEWWKERRDGVAIEQTSGSDTFEQVYGGGRTLEVIGAGKQALEGGELTVYQQWLATQRQLQATLQGGAATILEASADVLDDASSESSSDSEGSQIEKQGKALNVSTTLGQASRKKVVLSDEGLGVNIMIKKKGVHDFDIRGKKGKDRMFPIVIRRKRNDEFGELIRPEDYLRAEEREDADGPETAGTGQAGNRQQEDGLGKKRKWDDVGTGPTKGFSRPNKRPQLTRAISADEPDAAALAHGPAGDELDNLEDEEEVILGPSKLVLTTDLITVRLRIAFVDFSGLHDKRSLNMLIPLIQPRKLVLVAGGEEETLTLAADCRKLLTAKLGTTSDGHAVEVLTPAVGATVDASVDTNAWVVKLADPFIKRLRWQNVRGLGIVTVTGLLLPGGEIALTDVNHDEDTANKRPRIEGGTDDSTEVPEPITTTSADSKALVTKVISSAAMAAVIPVLDVLPTNMASATRAGAQPLHVGDLRLADLRRAMLNAGYKAEFRGEGTLLIDEIVVVRKTSTGRVELESAGLFGSDMLMIPTAAATAMGGGSTFYAVRKKIYEGLAIVAGA
ncbi:beta-lactamase-like protein [Lasiosphaeria miniovina]|uniref:Cleavage and polyadenylation specificity factor subunit 2 n=1 Tax=Lasiosphaeria miniovina TaxID=1954250 RepID=A0AA40AC94_9PEZI|nr:beta-lactamase-like protein [Lasiosphaeria miniovina]KAK0713065.1 beta-lactamase-like protein [Lasiosphaeria miniovina]